MKKLLALLLTVCLVATLILPAAAADAGLDDRMAKVTLSVKKTLQIGDEYTEFSGNLMEEEPHKLWSLNWKKENTTLTVMATETGRIFSYDLYFYDDITEHENGEIKKFPKLKEAEANKIAENFLSRVLNTRLESVTLEKGRNYISRYENEDYYFNGSMKIKGLKSPIGIHLAVNGAKKMVTSFSRDDYGDDYSSLASRPKISKELASKTLFDTVKMELNYVLSEPDSKHAVLQYTPKVTANYMVDALSGKLVELMPVVYFGAMKQDSARNESTSGLTDVEQKTVKELAGALSAQELEIAARQISELKITSDFKLSNINYYTQATEQETTIVAILNFNKQIGSNENGQEYLYAGKTLQLDAKTGKLISSSAYSSSSKDPKINYSVTQCEAIARAFAGKLSANELQQTKLVAQEVTQEDYYQEFLFVREVNGIPFPANSIVLSVNRTDGSIGTYQISWNDEMTFADPKGIKTEQEAKDIYTKASGIGLCYAMVSVGENKSEMKLVYDLVDQTIWGVDAASGNVLKYEENETETFRYSDISGHYAKKQIEELAEYGIGYRGEFFAPDQKLSQKDALTLIVAASGYTDLDQNSEEYEENLYSAVYSMGILNKEEKNPTAFLTRAQLTKLILDASAYREAAKIKNIYRIGFKDDKLIAEDLFGYVAIAKGLGMIQGDTRGYFSPNTTATRGQLAVMLYEMMS